MSNAPAPAVKEAQKLPLDLEFDDSEDDSDYQDIPGHKVNPTKLAAMLRTNFGVGSYTINVMYNMYSVKAPRRLSLVGSNTRNPVVCEVANDFLGRNCQM